MDIGEKEFSVPSADVVIEKPVEDEAFHDVGFEEQGCVSAPSFSGPDIGLLVDMLAEQATRGTVGPPFESDSFTVPVIGTDLVMIPGISSLPRSDGLAGPAIGTDTLTTTGIPRVPEDLQDQPLCLMPLQYLGPIVCIKAVSPRHNREV
ncbi:uncharacterized protein LOC109836346 isoform X3 [Asparagus officinalis]|uniref:uncharacterized protein LOC109836346 isoform X3 n=1 Tax=Asparagus officinalis TaxID=4686 RepID=UPI00098E5E05|nr:uncharacterized protein LOC109836346 isoform X3 [Asparagus officinalis]XP_020259801.1 uncharacterized protein LOC109836346 isoform X3 [Asparagus officinalis]XP_020259802.1 uncharacterized protein LOC109836346 isoform X3 [Asparagus officinalis]XP_020259803.1 uncharacterized protein LOC109836346 isoform X3 [Asparagus officinalis]